MEDLEDGVGQRGGEDSLSFEDVMDMWLRNPGEDGESAFRQLAAADPLPKMFDKAVFQVLKVHKAYFS